MVNSELYQPIKAMQIEGSTHREIQGVRVPSVGIPFKNGHIPQFSIVSVNGDFENEKKTEDILVKISSIHQRSYELRFGATGCIYWSDEYGNIFSTLTTKGNNFDYPKALKSQISPSGFLFYGLQDSDSMVRVLRVSELLRSKNVATELIVKVIEPMRVPIDGELVTLEEFKKRLVRKVWDENAEKGSKDPKVYVSMATNVSREDIPDLSSALDKMTFFITIRGHQVSERLRDIVQPQSKEDFQSMMQRVFRYVNKVELIGARKDSKHKPSFFDVQKDEDITRYLMEYLPQKIATNFAKMHNLGLILDYCHAGNISAAGGFYDLDSVKGEAAQCGDSKITKREIDEEREKVFNELWETISTLKSRRFFSHEGETARIAHDNYYKTYFEERGWEKNILAHLDEINESFENFGLNSQRDLIEYYLRLITEQTGWNYEHNETLEQLSLVFHKEDQEEIRKRIEGTLKNPGQVRSVEEIITKCLTGKIDEEDLFDSSSSDRFVGFVISRIDQALLERHVNEFSEIENKYGDQAVIHLTRLISNREGSKIFDIITPEFHKRLEETTKARVGELSKFYLENAKEFYTDFLKNQDAKFDALSLIRVLFREFDFFNDYKDTRDLYLQRVSEQIEWDYQHPEDYSQVIQQYFQHLDLKIRAYFVKEWSKNLNPFQFDESFNRALDNAYSEYGLFDSVVERVIRIIKEVYLAELDELVDKYKEGDIDLLVTLFADREADRILIGMETEKEIEGIKRRKDALNERLRNELRERYFGVK